MCSKKNKIPTLTIVIEFISLSVISWLDTLMPMTAAISDEALPSILSSFPYLQHPTGSIGDNQTIAQLCHCYLCLVSHGSHIEQANLGLLLPNGLILASREKF